MAKEQHLMRLIATMDQSERRYFTLKTGSKDKQKGYQKLYRKLVAIPDEQLRVAEELPVSTKKISNLSRAKNQLYEQILRILHQKYEDVFTEDEISRYMTEAQLLKKKGMAEQSAIRYQEAKKKAIKYQSHYQHCAIIDQQLVLAMNHQDKDIMNHVLSLHEEKKQTLKLIKRREKFEMMHDQAMVLYRRDSHLREPETAQQAEKLINDLLVAKPKATSFLAQLSCLKALALLYRLKQEQDEAIYYYQNMLELWERRENKCFRDTLPDLYKLHVYNYMGVLHKSRKYEEYDTLLRKLAAYPARFLEEEVEDFQNVYFYQFLRYMNTGLDDLTQQTASEIATKMARYSKEVEIMIDSRKITLLYNIGIFYFIIQEDFQEARDWFIQVIHATGSKEQRLDLKHLSRIFLLIIDYETGKNHDKLIKLQESTRKLLTRYDYYFEFEKLIISKLKALMKCVPGEERAIFAELVDSLHLIMKAQKTRNGLAEVQIWAQSRTNGVSMKSIVEEN